MTIIRKLRGIALALALLAALALCGAAQADGLDVHFMDIGRNDGIVIVCDGEAAFIDSGWYEFSLQAVDYMRGLGITHLKYYIGTHAHKDHVSGAAAIIKAFNPDAVLQPHADVGRLIIQCAATKEERAAAENARYINVSVGQTYNVGGATLTVLGPLKLRKFYNADDGYENFNSLIMRLTYGENTFLLTGDAYAATLYDIEAAFPGALKCDVFKNPHHDGAPKDKEMALVSPQYVIFSTSDKHQPTSEALARVGDVGARAMITSTQQNGHIVFHSDGHNLGFFLTNGPLEISINKSEATIYEGQKTSVSAKLKPSHYKALTYFSLNPSVASVDGSGHITGLAPGTAIIRAMSSNCLYTDCVVTVMPIGVQLNKNELRIKHGASDTLRASFLPKGTRSRAVAWSSDDPAVATVTDSGKVTGAAPGSTTVRATLENGSQAACVVTVEPVAVSGVKISPSGATLTIHQSQALSAVISPQNATDQSVVWSSDDESVAIVDQNGLLTAVGVGQTKITATASNGKNRSIGVKVKPVYISSISIAADTDTIVAGVPGKNTVQMSAGIQPLDATIQEIVWKTSNPRVATVDENGLVTAVNDGHATIYAVSQDGSHRQGSFRLTVAANRFMRSAAVFEPGRVTVSAESIRYERDTLRVDLYYANGTDEHVNIPSGGVLTFILPDGTRLPIAPMEMGTRTLRRGTVKTHTIRLPLASYPYLAGLDLTSCDATVTN